LFASKNSINDIKVIEKISYVCRTSLTTTVHAALNS
jgi:hypothetical protein